MMLRKQFVTKFLILSILLFTGIQASSAQEDEKIIDIGFEFQAYPTGLLPGIKATFGLDSRNAIHVRAGFNLINHRDLGVQDSEKGWGGGGTIGYEHYFGDNLTRWFVGGRSDFWYNSINWESNIGPIVSGNTKVFVIQPTVIGGYMFELGNGNIAFAPTLGFGFEINAATNGAEVGQGPIGLIGFVFAKRTRKAAE
ncbi:MAG: hypothetical protein AAF502_12515 [Bacteroidota bacterium]